MIHYKLATRPKAFAAHFTARCHTLSIEEPSGFMSTKQLWQYQPGDEACRRTCMYPLCRQVYDQTEQLCLVYFEQLRGLAVDWSTHWIHTGPTQAFVCCIWYCDRLTTVNLVHFLDRHLVILSACELHLKSEPGNDRCTHCCNIDSADMYATSWHLLCLT